MTHKENIVIVLILSFALALSANATTYVNMTDEALVAEAPIIAEATILTQEPGPAPFTDYHVEVVTTLKGFLPGGTLLVRVPEGTRANGLRMHLSGVPRLKPGGRALLFLTPGEDGAYRIYQLSLGVFHQVEDGGLVLALRDLRGALVLDPVGTPHSARQVRDFQGFKDWVRREVRGMNPVADYLREPPTGPHSLQEFFTLFESGGLNLRWTVFDNGGSTTFFAHQAGQPGVPGGGFTEFQAALAAWNADPETPISLLYGGTNSQTGGLTTFDGFNTIVFDDPNSNSLFGGAFNCILGGVLAIGGPWFSSADTHSWNGMTFIRIQGGDVVTNKNVGCFLSQNNSAEEVFAHEIGHTLGLRHSCGDADSGPCNTATKDQALMRATAHGDGRGAALNSDDEAGIAFLYKSSLIFEDGFESGDTQAWSSQTP